MAGLPTHPVRHDRRTAVAVAAALACALPTLSALPAGAATDEGDTTTTARADARGRAPQPIVTTRWGGRLLQGKGRFEHTRYRHGAIRIGRNPVRVHFDDPHVGGGALAYDRGTWTSPWVRPGIRFDELIASYDVGGRAGTWVKVSVRGRTTGGKRGSWDVLARYGYKDRRFRRASLGEQPDDFSHVNVDTVQTDGKVRYRAWQLRFDLYRRSGTERSPALRRVNAVVSNLPSVQRRTSRPLFHTRRVVPVPQYSQMLHSGTYPQWDNGGEAWCSPTSTSMVLGRWDHLPKASAYSWVKNGKGQPWVVHAARYVYDYTYEGAGNWPFNTAYASHFGLDGFVTRLRSLREAELMIRRGIPVVTTVSFGPGELDGAPINSTGGHLMVIRGFTARGHVIVNDPAAPKRSTVRRVYKRSQFENAWIDNNDGTAYIIHPDSVALPRPSRHSNW